MNLGLCGNDLVPEVVMAITGMDRVFAAPGVLVNEAGGESVILNLKSQTYYSLDGVGTRAWALLVGSGSIQAALEQLLTEYDVDPERLRLDLMHLVTNLVNLELLEVRSE
jgi:hypothetical protein